MAKVILKEMNEDHILKVQEISELSLKESWSFDSLKRELDNKLANYTVALIDDEVVGFAGSWAIAPEGQVTNIAVHPSFRGQGIGFSLVNELMSNLKSIGCTEITLEVRESNINAQKLYEKCGFKNEGIRKNFYPDKENAIIMWKKD